MNFQIYTDFFIHLKITQPLTTNAQKSSMNSQAFDPDRIISCPQSFTDEAISKIIMNRQVCPLTTCTVIVHETESADESQTHVSDLNIMEQGRLN